MCVLCHVWHVKAARPGLNPNNLSRHRLAPPLQPYIWDQRPASPLTFADNVVVMKAKHYFDQRIWKTSFEEGSPTGKLSPFSAYVALSRSRGRDTIHLLQDFDERLFTNHPSGDLATEVTYQVLINEEKLTEYAGASFAPLGFPPPLVSIPALLIASASSDEQG